MPDVIVLEELRTRRSTLRSSAWYYRAALVNATVVVGVLAVLASFGRLAVLWLLVAFILGALYMVVASVWGSAKKFTQPLDVRTEFSADGVRTTFGDVVSNVNWAALTPGKSSDRYRTFAISYGANPVVYPADALTAGQWAEVNAMRTAAVANSVPRPQSARLDP